MVKRLNVMNDTFTALEIIANHVTAIETCMSKFVGRLSERAKALGMDHLTMDGMKHAREAVVAVEANVSSALKNIALVAKDDVRKWTVSFTGERKWPQPPLAQVQEQHGDGARRAAVAGKGGADETRRKAE
ncbi:hypothetical protein TRVL_07649 [Trypanosoma vivax]|nr:hypothetical protein TRVL_07649 [Trypanosoma vivax]